MSNPAFTLLSAAAPVTAIVAQRIFKHGRAPPGVAKPYITYAIVGGHTENYVDGPPGTAQIRVQLDCWSLDSAQCEQLKEAVIDALKNNGQQAGIEQDDFEEDTQLYRWLIEFYFWIPR